MKPKIFFTLVAAFSLFTLAGPPRAVGVEYYILTDVGKLDNAGADVRMNNQGVILVRHLFGHTVLFAQGQQVDLSLLTGIEGYDLNDNGIVVGRIFFNSVMEWHAVALLKNKPSDLYGTNIVDLGLISTNPVPQRALLAINNSDEVLVCCTDSSDVFSRGAYTVPLVGAPKTVLPTNLIPKNISDYGGFGAAPYFAVGSYFLPSPNTGRNHAALFYTLPIVDLGTLAGTNPLIDSTALDAQYVNGVLTVVGYSGTGGMFDHAFRWDTFSGMVDLDVNPHPEKLGPTEAHAINKRGEIVGVIDPLLSHAAIFKDNNVIDLNFAFPKGIFIRGAQGWTLQTASAINDYGEIAGWGNVKNGTEARVYMLTPVRPFIQAGGNHVIVSWPALLNGFSLEATDDLSSPGAWRPMPDTPTIQGRLKVVTLPVSGNARFFRLTGT